MNRKLFETVLRWTVYVPPSSEISVRWFFRMARRWYRDGPLYEWDEDILELCLQRYHNVGTVPEFVWAYCRNKIYPERIVRSFTMDSSV